MAAARGSKEPDVGTPPEVAAPAGVQAEAVLAAANAAAAGVSNSEIPEGAQEVAVHPPVPPAHATPAPVVPNRQAALRALVSMPGDRHKKVPESPSIVPATRPRDLNLTGEGDLYRVVAVRFNAAVGEGKGRRFLPTRAGDTIRLTSDEAAWGLKTGSIEKVAEAGDDGADAS